MNDEQVRAGAGVCLVGGSDVCPEVLAKVLKFAPFVVAADGGADRAQAAGLTVRAVIGDLDSISDEVRASLDPAQIVEVEEQDTTDFEKCLARIEAPFIVGIGFTGGRLDHTLAAMSVLARRIGPPTVLIDSEDVIFAAPGEVALDLPPKTRVSLFPMARVQGRSTGLRWPINGLTFSPTGRIGTSNVSTGPVTLSFDQPGMLVVLPSSELGSVTPALHG